MGSAVNIQKLIPGIPGWRGALLGRPAFFAAFFLCCWRWVDLRLIYHGGGVIANYPVFYWGWDFFRESWAKPGGALAYAHAWLSQCLIHPAVGSAALTALAWLASGFQAAVLQRAGAGRIRLLSLAPALLLLSLCAKYTYYVPASLAAAAVLAGCAAAVLWAALRPARVSLRQVGLLALGGVVYWLASEAFPVFFMLGLLLELRAADRWRMLPAFLPLAGLPFLAGRWGWDLTGPEVWVDLFPFGLSLRAFKSGGLALLHALYLSLPASLAIWLAGTAWTRRLSARRGAGPPPPAAAASDPPKAGAARETRPANTKRPEPSAPAGTPGGGGTLWRRAAWAVLLAASPAVVWAWSANRQLKAVLQVDYFSHHKMWPQVLEAARGATGSIHALCAQNRALYHTGRLGDDLPLGQDAESLLLYDQKYRPEWSVIDIYLDLGFLNMANHYLVEAVDIYGERPSLLRRLALVNAAIGNSGTARIYFHALRRVPFHAAWAEECLRQLDRDPTLAAHEEVAGWRQWRMKEDHVIPLPVDQLMLKLLDANRQNRMAFEYFSAHCLLTKNLPAWLAQLHRLPDFAWGELPRLYQEAIVLAVRGLGAKVDLKNLRVGGQQAQRFDAFLRQLKFHGADRKAAAEALRKEYATTYYYFYYLQ